MNFEFFDGALRDYIKRNGGRARRDAMQNWLAKRAPDYKATFDGMLSRGEIVAERDGKRYFIRFTTPAEREAAEIAAGKEAKQTTEFYMSNFLETFPFGDDGFKPFDERTQLKAPSPRINVSFKRAEAARLLSVCEHLDISPAYFAHTAIAAMLDQLTFSPEAMAEVENRLCQLRCWQASTLAEAARFKLAEQRQRRAEIDDQTRGRKKAANN